VLVLYLPELPKSHGNTVTGPGTGHQEEFGGIVSAGFDPDQESVALQSLTVAVRDETVARPASIVVAQVNLLVRGDNAPLGLRMFQNMPVDEKAFKLGLQLHQRERHQDRYADKNQRAHGWGIGFDDMGQQNEKAEIPANHQYSDSNYHDFSLPVPTQVVPLSVMS
jgi:hypothetical protein